MAATERGHGDDAARGLAFLPVLLAMLGAGTFCASALSLSPPAPSAVDPETGEFGPQSRRSAAPGAWREIRSPGAWRQIRSGDASVEIEQRIAHLRAELRELE